VRYPCSAVQLKLIMATLATCRGTSLIRNNPFPRTLQQDYTQGPTVVLREVGVFCERGTPVGCRRFFLIEVPLHQRSRGVQGTPLRMNRASLGPYSRNMPRALWWL